MKGKIALASILVCAFLIRIYGINWDQDQHLHPDERFLTMVANDAKVPASFFDYIDPDISTLNPYNLKYKFYVYGTFPVTLAKLVAIRADMNSYNGITIIGRSISAICDTGIVLLIFLLARLWEKRYRLNTALKYVAAFLYTIAVLPIQQAHFFSSDAISTFFSLLSIYAAFLFINKPRVIFGLVSAISIGLALASKISTIYVVPLVGILFILGVIHKKLKLKDVVYICLLGIMYCVVVYITLRLGDPRFFSNGNFFDVTINPLFISNIKELGRLTAPNSTFPPQIQWLSKQAVIFPLKNIVLYGIGIPYFLLSIIGIVSAAKSREREIWIVLGWMMIFFLYQGTRTTMSLRYFYILYPFFALFAAWVLSQHLIQKGKILVMTVLLVCLIWPYAFMHIYTKPHSRVTASEWIYGHIPAGSNLALEHWEDFMPLTLPEVNGIPARLSNRYSYIEMRVFDMDTPQKRAQLNENLQKADYYIISSNRGYGSILPMEKMFPYTAQFYKDMFNERLGFTKVAEITSFPTINMGLVKIPLNDQGSEEAFTVYDHPRILIYKNNNVTTN